MAKRSAATQKGLYVVMVKLVEGGQIYAPGDVSDFEDLSEDRLVFLLYREFLWPVAGYESLTGEFGDRVRELRG